MAFNLTVTSLKKYQDGKITREQIVDEIMDNASAYLFGLQDKVVKAAVKVNSNLENNSSFNKSVSVFIANELDQLLIWVTSELDNLLKNSSPSSVISIIKQEVELSAGAIKDIPLSAKSNNGRPLGELVKELRGGKEKAKQSDSINQNYTQQTKTEYKKSNLASDYIKPKSGLFTPKPVAPLETKSDSSQVKEKSISESKVVVKLLEQIEENTRNGSSGSSGILRRLRGMFGKMTDILLNPLKYFKNLLMAPFIKIQSLLISLKDKVLAPFKFIGSMFGKMVNGIKSFFGFGKIDQNKFRKLVLKTLKELVDTDKKILSALSGYTAPKEPVESKPEDKKSNWFENIKKFLPIVIGGLASMILKPFTILKGMWDSIKSIWDILKNGPIVKFLESMVKAIGSIVTPLLEFFGLKKAVDTVSSIPDVDGVGNKKKQLPPRDEKGRFKKIQPKKTSGIKNIGKNIAEAGSKLLNFGKLGVGKALGTSALGTVAAVGAVGYAGYETGTWLDNKFGLSDKISDFFLPKQQKLDKSAEYIQTHKKKDVPSVQPQQTDYKLNEVTQKTEQIKDEAVKQAALEAAQTGSNQIVGAVNNVVNNTNNTLAMRSIVRSEERTFSRYWQSLQPSLI